MHPLFNYDVVIFDCDGVILDSNQLKIIAMKEALESGEFPDEHINAAVHYFKSNFGKSRFHHVKYFIKNIAKIEFGETLEKKIIDCYSSLCESLYKEAGFTLGFPQLLGKLEAKLYVASGSEQAELRRVFKHKGILQYFENVYGSPTAKSENVKSIIDMNKSKNILMIGDSMSDFEASNINKIDFIFYAPYSNVEIEMRNLALLHQFQIIDSFEDIC